MEEIKKFIDEHLEVVNSLRQSNVEEIKRITEDIVKCFKNGNKVLICGNGGSAADAQHFAAELVSDYKIKRPGLPVLALTTNTSTLTSIGNDSGFDNVFSRQVEAFANKGDIVIVFTTSDIEENVNGHSTDIYKAVLAAKKKESKVIGFISERGEKISKLVDLAFIVKSKNTPRVQECHELAYHIICELVEKELFGKG